jgi:hypothetical protein
MLSKQHGLLGEQIDPTTIEVRCFEPLGYHLMEILMLWTLQHSQHLKAHQRSHQQHYLPAHGEQLLQLQLQFNILT